MSFDREAAAADREASGVDSRAADPRGPSLRWLAWVGLVALLALYLGRIGGFALQDPDEGRYAEIPREMIELNDWVTPRLDYVRYFEKPPLLYWLVGMSYQAFGMTEASARLARESQPSSPPGRSAGRCSARGRACSPRPCSRPVPCSS